MEDKADMLQLGLDALRGVERGQRIIALSRDPEQQKQEDYERRGHETIAALRLALAQGIEQRRMAVALERIAAAWEAENARMMHILAAADDPTANATCVVCGEGFTPAEWDDRHWPVDGGEAHARCCPDCHRPRRGKP